MTFRETEELVDKVARGMGANEAGEIPIFTNNEEFMPDDVIREVMRSDSPKEKFYDVLNEWAAGYATDYGYPELVEAIEANMSPEDRYNEETMADVDYLVDNYSFTYPDEKLLAIPVKMNVDVAVPNDEYRYTRQEISMTLDEAMTVYENLAEGHVNGVLKVEQEGRLEELPMTEICGFKFKESGTCDKNVKMLKNMGREGDVFDKAKVEEAVRIACTKAIHDKKLYDVEKVVAKMAKLAKGAEVKETGMDALKRLCEKEFEIEGIKTPGKLDYKRFAEEKIIPQEKDKPMKVHYKNLSRAYKAIENMLDKGIVKMAKKFEEQQKGGQGRI